jgi:hypothetical protein
MLFYVSFDVVIEMARGWPQMRVRWESDSDPQIRFAEVGLAMVDLFQLGLLGS